jgi:hypothetical protein
LELAMRAKQSLFQRQRMLAVVVCGGSCAFVGAQSREQSVTAYPTVQVVDKPLEYRQFEKVEITGSSIVRKEQLFWASYVIHLCLDQYETINVLVQYLKSELEDIEFIIKHKCVDQHL